jgi:tetratricopeptide (TPR) repeat protein
MNHPARIERARLLLGQSRYDLAAVELQLALADSPNDPVVHALLSECLTGQQKYADAVAAAERAVGCAPDLPIGHYALALAQFRRRHFPEAEAAANEAIQLDPTDPNHHALKAAVRAEREDWQGVLAAADRGLEFDPEHTWCENLRAWALTHLGRKDEAGAVLDETLARSPEDSFTHSNRGWGFLHEGNPKRAAEHFREALRLDPGCEFARLGMIEALKARYRLYRWVLGYFLWMSRFSPQTRWAIVIGVLVVQQIVAGLSRSHPALKPVLEPLLIGYAAFALTTWTAAPLSNLFLRLNRFGRYALSSDQRRASNWVALFVCGALAAVGWGLFAPAGYTFLGWEAAPPFIILLMPVAATYACQPGWPRWTMAAVTVGVAGLVLTGVTLFGLAVYLDRTDGRTAIAYAELGEDLLLASIWSGAGSTFLANWLVSVRPRL